MRTPPLRFWWLLTSGFLAFSPLIMWSDSAPRPTAPVMAGRDSGVTDRLHAASPLVQSAYGKLPLPFEPNLGQFDPQVRYAARGGGYTVFLTDSEAVMVLSRHQAPQDGAPGQPQKLEQAAVRMKLVGARPTVRWEALETQKGVSNYFLGSDPAKWRTNVPNYARVAAREVYEGIDLVCYGNQRQLEYDLDAAPGADLSQVQLAWEGALSLRLNRDGDLVLATRLGDLLQKRPRVYQDVDGRRIEVGSKYVVSGRNRVRFELASYDRSRRLLIDPLVLAYSTYLGGSGQDWGRNIALGAGGTIHFVGNTPSANFPIQSAYQGTYQGGDYDVFVTKLSATGDALIYSTYLGGSGDDGAYAVAVDPAGSAYVTGFTASTNFPIRNAYQAAYRGGIYDAYVAKLAPAGNALVYSTYLGGSDSDVAFGIALDTDASAVVTGYTYSTNFPTYGPYPSTYHGGSSDAFVTKLTPEGNAVYYSNYLGGGGQDWGFSIAVGTGGVAYVTGCTSSTDFPTRSPYQATNRGGARDAFVTELGNQGSLIYSTYLGGSGEDFGYGIAIDGTGSAYVTGYTTSTDFPTLSPYQAALHGAQDAFVTKLAPAGNALVYSTFLGGGGTEYGFDIAVDGAGSAYTVGWTSSTDFPTLAAYQSTYQGGNYDTYVTRLTPAGNALGYSTYLGGNGDDNGDAIVVDLAGATYVAGRTSSTNFPTQSAFQSTYQGGADDGFVVKLTENAAGFALLSPVNGATGVPLAPTLSWSTSAGATSYDVYLGPSASPPQVTTTAGTSYTPPALPAGTLYYWRVVANGTGGPISTATWSFTTVVVLPPPAPVLITPANGATGVATTPMLSWNASTGATSYDVHFGTSASPPVFDNTTMTTYPMEPLSAATTYYWQIVARGPGGTSASSIWSFTTTASPPSGLRFVPVPPCRVADTRDPAGPFGGPAFSAGSTRSFPIPQSACGIPASAQAYSLNVTVVPSGPLWYLTLWPAGQAQPLVSTLNSFSGDVVANAAIVPAGTNGGVSVYSTSNTHLILDINGYFDNSSSANSYWFFPAVPPCRVADTRNPVGQFGGPTMQTGQSRDFPVTLSGCGIHATAAAYSLNVTVVPPGYLGYLTLWPTGAVRPTVSTLNSWTGKIVANAALVPAGANKSVSVYVSNPSDVILDVNGYFDQLGAGDGVSFYPVPPCRVADTRNPASPFGGPGMDAAATRTFLVSVSACNITNRAWAYSMNITVVPDGPLSYLTAWPAGRTRPLVSTLNSPDGAVVANAAIIPAGDNGAISIYVTDHTHVILDINGYFAE